MENAEIARVLREVADLLEIQGANPFRVRAYRSAARTIDDLTRPLTELVEEGADLTELPTIGKDIAGYITELVKTGRLGLLKEIHREVPASLAELTKLEGIGPKRATRLFRELGIRTVPQLKKAIARGEVEALPGFGSKLVDRMRRSIEAYEKHAKRIKLADADKIVQPLLEYLRRHPGVEEADAAGSVRRRRETIGDIDLVAACAHVEPVTKHFTAYPQAVRVEASGKTWTTLELRSGTRVDLRIVPPRSYGAGLHHFTGSKAHNIAVRKLAVERGLRINEYGVFRVAGTSSKTRRGGQRRIGGEKEADVYRAVGMKWVPPELREDRGEVEAALHDRLPHLVKLDDIRGDLQMHTKWSDGESTIKEMVRACRDRGYEFLAITDHSPSVAIAKGMTPKDLKAQWREIDKVRKEVKGITILKGMEVDILPDGRLDLGDDELHELELVVIAVHSSMRMAESKMTDRVIKAMSHPAVHILGHPTGRLINRREPIDIDLEAVLHAAAELGVAVELNAQPDRLDLNDVQVHRAKELGVTVAIDTDAHNVDALRYMTYGIDQARRGWLENGDILNCMRGPALKRWLAKRRK